VFYKILPELL